MFDGGRDQMLTLGLEQSRRSKNGKIVCLRAAAGKNNFARLGAEKFRGTIARFIQQRSRLAPDVMHRRRIAPNLAQKRQHRLTHRRVERSRGVVIEIDRAWHVFVAQASRLCVSLAIYDLRFTIYALQRAAERPAGRTV